MTKTRAKFQMSLETSRLNMGLRFSVPAVVGEVTLLARPPLRPLVVDLERLLLWWRGEAALHALL